MPVPTPSKGETQDKFMGRCMTFMMNENHDKPSGEKRPRKQITAICFSQWKEHHKSTSEQEASDKETFEEFLERYLVEHPELKLIEE